ncbi:hypothetical protein ZEAMMB73_Zm00001d045117 [Zea mays]|uniref:Uncharacterized protein n=1 Tax=Zea mays TaxID=4577 RepID=A0A1D6NTT4_MAIZE|nr:hypothetical protein ZEAMMB73_Zm00001d045117 [Zea mays]
MSQRGAQGLPIDLRGDQDCDDIYHSSFYCWPDNWGQGLSAVLRNQVTKGTGDSSTNTAIQPIKNGHCSNTEGKAWDPLATKITCSIARGSPALTPSMCF